MRPRPHSRHKYDCVSPYSSPNARASIIAETIVFSIGGVMPFAVIVGKVERLVLAGHVENEAKEGRCCPNIPKSPTVKRHITTKDKPEGVDRAMQLHARAIT
jgi:hypothetical protein